MKKPTLEISYLEYRKLTKNKDGKPRKKHKYNAKSTLVDGVHFPSKLEAAVWCSLKMDKKTYRNVKRYPSVKFPDDTWKIDFSCERHFLESWTPIYVEAKGAENNEYLKKLKLYEKYGDRPLEIWKGDAANPFLLKTIIPKGLKK